MNTLFMRISIGLVTFAAIQHSYAHELPERFSLQPIDTNIIGIGAANEFGDFRRLNDPPPRFRYFVGKAGALILDFGQVFEDGANTDFAIVTSAEAWGPEATTALFQFFLGGDLQPGTFIATLQPDKVHRFEIPGQGTIANRIVITNISPGTGDTTMTFDNAGVSHEITTNPGGVDPE